MSLRFHKATFDLLGRAPSLSKSGTAQIAERERCLGVSFPESFREWYGLAGAVEILAKHSNEDCPLSLQELGEEERDELVEHKILVFMYENQSVCKWGVKLNGSPDPAVMVSVDEEPWLPCVASFSTFVFCQVWDHTDIDYCLAAQEKALKAEDLEFLREHFKEGPRTEAWPPHSMNHRFSGAHGTVLIWNQIGLDWTQADWWLRSGNPDGLEALAALLWNRGSLRSTLYSCDDRSETVLARLRS